MVERDEKGFSVPTFSLYFLLLIRSRVWWWSSRSFCLFFLFYIFFLCLVSFIFFIMAIASRPFFPLFCPKGVPCRLSSHPSSPCHIAGLLVAHGLLPPSEVAAGVYYYMAPAQKPACLNEKSKWSAPNPKKRANRRRRIKEAVLELCGLVAIEKSNSQTWPGKFRNTVELMKWERERVCHKNI